MHVYMYLMALKMKKKHTRVFVFASLTQSNALCSQLSNNHHSNTFYFGSGDYLINNFQLTVSFLGSELLGIV